MGLGSRWIYYNGVLFIVNWGRGGLAGREQGDTQYKQMESRI